MESGMPRPFGMRGEQRAAASSGWTWPTTAAFLVGCAVFGAAFGYWVAGPVVERRRCCS